METEILSYNDRYSITRDGEVYSSAYSKRRKLKPQKASQSKKGYYQVRLYDKVNRRDSKGRKIGKLFYVHRLVWETFIGDIPKDKQIDHIDGDTSNNSIENLQLLTPRDNLIKGLDKHWRPYRDEFIKFYEKLGSYKKVAELYKINQNVVYRVIKDVIHRIDYKTGAYTTERYNPTFNDFYTETNLRSKEGKDEKNRRRK